MYSQEKVDMALQLYHQCESVTETIRILGYRPDISEEQGKGSDG